MTVVGAAIEAGVLFLAAVEPASEHRLRVGSIPSGMRRVEPNPALDEARRLVDLTHRLEDNLRAMSASRVGLARTRKFSGMSYGEAFARVSAMCALMTASVAADIEFVELTTEAISKRVGVPAKSLETVPPEAFGFSGTPTYWRAGMAKAHAAGATLVPALEQT